MNRGGRPTHVIWEKGNFHPVRDENGWITGAQCLSCNKPLMNTAKKRLMKHKEKCLNTLGLSDANDLSIINPIYIDSSSLDSLSSNSTLSNIITTEPADSASGRSVLEIKPDVLPTNSEAVISCAVYNSKSVDKIKMKGRKKNMDEYFGITTPEGKHLTYKLLAKLIYGCNLSVDIVQSKHFINYSKSSRPGYDPPALEKLTSDLLWISMNKLKKRQSFQIKMEYYF